jgi:hypothetical protein
MMCKKHRRIAKTQKQCHLKIKLKNHLKAPYLFRFFLLVIKSIYAERLFCLQQAVCYESLIKKQGPLVFKWAKFRRVRYV